MHSSTTTCSGQQPRPAPPDRDASSRGGRETVVIRTAGAGDSELLARLAALDSADASGGRGAARRGGRRAARRARARLGPVRRRSLPAHARAPRAARAAGATRRIQAVGPAVEWRHVRADDERRGARGEPAGTPYDQGRRRDRTQRPGAGRRSRRRAGCGEPREPPALEPGRADRGAAAGKAAASPESRERLKEAAREPPRAEALSRTREHARPAELPPPRRRRHTLRAAAVPLPAGAGSSFFARPARHQLLARLARHAAGVARPRPVQPVLPRPGDGGRRRLDHVEGHGDPGHVQEGHELRRLEGGDAFSTEIPAFADTKSLSSLLEAEERRRQREAAHGQRRRGGRTCSSASGRRSCSSALLVLLMRRAGNAQGVLGSFGRSRARRYEPSGDRVTFADVAGIDEAKQELTRGRRLPAPPREVRAARRAHPARRAALGAAGHRQDAARARGRR